MTHNSPGGTTKSSAKIKFELMFAKTPNNWPVVALTSAPTAPAPG